ncbi:hypothetical protein LX36DRAFT_391705 [Colletotrichum falcatum]|nr:hypothetical protein LX36DRAFT_391705 [Colletotrichum falcatum]
MVSLSLRRPWQSDSNACQLFASLRTDRPTARPGSLCLIYLHIQFPGAKCQRRPFRVRGYILDAYLCFKSRSGFMGEAPPWLRVSKPRGLQADAVDVAGTFGVESAHLPVRAPSESNFVDNTNQCGWHMSINRALGVQGRSTLGQASAASRPWKQWSDGIVTTVLAGDRPDSFSQRRPVPTLRIRFSCLLYYFHVQFAVLRDSCQTPRRSRPMALGLLQPLNAAVNDMSVECQIPMFLELRGLQTIGFVQEP